MKKHYVLFIAMIIMVLLAGCLSSPAAAPRAATTPPWMEELPPQDVFWGIGFIKLQNETLAMQTATQNAQRDVAAQVSVLVQGLLENYANESGLASNPRSMIAIENITRTLVNMNLSGATVNARTRMDDGTWYVRVEYRKSDAQRTAANVVNNEMADFAEFRSDQFRRQLDFEIDRTQSRPTPRSE